MTDGYYESHDLAAEHPLDNAIWHSLNSYQADLAEVTGGARRYFDSVNIFAAVDDPASSWDDLAQLAGPSQHVVLFRDQVPAPPPAWHLSTRGQGYQMIATTLGETQVCEIRQLGDDDVVAMLDLTEATQPGPFRPETIRMGRYFGVFDADRLVAMAGERMHLTGWTEISAVCTHPTARGRGLAASLTRHVAMGILDRDEQPFLHVAEPNDNARRVYERLGFVTRRMVEFVALRTPPALV